MSKKIDLKNKLEKFTVFERGSLMTVFGGGGAKYLELFKFILVFCSGQP
jgi:hypothetical protein